MVCSVVDVGTGVGVGVGVNTGMEVGAVPDFAWKMWQLCELLTHIGSFPKR
jgi:hypothetical protein